MKYRKWLKNNTCSLEGKTVALTGATGGIGRELCRYILSLGGKLLMLDRNMKRSLALRERLLKEFPQALISNIPLDLENIDSVRAALELLRKETPDVFIHNAGAYSIPRHKCSTGLDNVFQINFVSPYFITRELLKLEGNIKIVAVGSVAHRYSVTDAEDIDFSKRKASSLVYGNAKRYLMLSFWALAKEEKHISVAHPGITLTNITAHYPPWLFAIIKHPMKIIFMHPKKAALCIIKGIFEDCDANEWIGPRIFDVWGFPRKGKLRGIDTAEIARVSETAEKIYVKLEEGYA